MRGWGWGLIKKPKVTEVAESVECKTIMRTTLMTRKAPAQPVSFTVNAFIRQDRVMMQELEAHKMLHLVAGLISEGNDYRWGNRDSLLVRAPDS